MDFNNIENNNLSNNYNNGYNNFNNVNDKKNNNVLLYGCIAIMVIFLFVAVYFVFFNNKSSGISYTVPKKEMKVGETIDIDAKYKDGTSSDIAFSTDNPAVVNVDNETGEITAKKEGTAKITVYLKSDSSVYETFTITIKGKIEEPNDEPVEDEPKQNEPVEDEPIEEPEPVEDKPKQEETKKEETKQEEPKKEETKTEPKKEETKQETPTPAPVQDTPKQDEPKKEDQKQEVKKEEDVYYTVELYIMEPNFDDQSNCCSKPHQVYDKNGKKIEGAYVQCYCDSIGTIKLYTTQKVKKGSKVTKPTNPADCKSISWFLSDDDSGSEYNFNSPITEDMKLIGFKTYDPITNLSLNKKSTTIVVGKTETLVATITPSTANKSITWTSSNIKVASVDQNGTVKGITAGDAVITAADGNKKASVKVTVKKAVKVTDIEVNAASVGKKLVLWGNEGSSIEANATALPKSASDKTLKYSVADTKIATVNEKGIIFAHKTGKTKLYIESVSNPNVKKEVEIQVYSKEGIVKFQKTSNSIVENGCKENDECVVGYACKVGDTMTIDVYSTSGGIESITSSKTNVATIKKKNNKYAVECCGTNDMQTIAVNCLKSGTTTIEANTKTGVTRSVYVKVIK